MFQVLEIEKKDSTEHWSHLLLWSLNHNVIEVVDWSQYRHHVISIRNLHTTKIYIFDAGTFSLSHLSCNTNIGASCGDVSCGFNIVIYPLFNEGCLNKWTKSSLRHILGTLLVLHCTIQGLVDISTIWDVNRASNIDLFHKNHHCRRKRFYELFVVGLKVPTQRNVTTVSKLFCCLGVTFKLVWTFCKYTGIYRWAYR